MSKNFTLKWKWVEIKIPKHRVMQGVLIILQFLFPGVSHLILRKWVAGAILLVLWIVVFAAYAVFGVPRIVLLAVPIIALVLLLSCKEFPKAENDKDD